jgi:hypothetical protein
LVRLSAPKSSSYTPPSRPSQSAPSYTSCTASPTSTTSSISSCTWSCHSRTIRRPWRERLRRTSRCHRGFGRYGRRPLLNKGGICSPALDHDQPRPDTQLDMGTENVLPYMNVVSSSPNPAEPLAPEFANLNLHLSKLSCIGASEKSTQKARTFSP